MPARLRPESLQLTVSGVHCRTAQILQRNVGFRPTASVALGPNERPCGSFRGASLSLVAACDWLHARFGVPLHFIALLARMSVQLPLHRFERIAQRHIGVGVRGAIVAFAIYVNFVAWDG